MNDSRILRIGASAAVLGVVAQLATAVVEPARLRDSDRAIREIAESGGWTGRWLVHLASGILILTALAVVTRTFSEGRAKEWARVGQPLFVAALTLGMAEVLVGASTKDLADGWAAAAPGEKLPYRAAFEGAWDETVLLDFGTILLAGLYLATLAAAILSSDVYARWLGWACAVAAAFVSVGIVLELWSPVGTGLDAVGSLTFFVVLIGLAVAMWKQAGSRAVAHDAFALDPGLPEPRRARSAT